MKNEASLRLNDKMFFYFKKNLINITEKIRRQCIKISKRPIIKKQNIQSANFFER